MVVIVIVVLHGDDEVPLVVKPLTPLPTDFCYKYHYGDGSEQSKNTTSQGQVIRWAGIGGGFFVMSRGGAKGQ